MRSEHIYHCISLLLSLIFLNLRTLAQEEKPARYDRDNTRWFSLGGRSTTSLFSDDGSGLGTGGQFRVQLSSRVNTDWFADYIVVNEDGLVRSEYYHIGWSVLFYPFENLQFPRLLQPYILAGHCFDYNKKTVLRQPGNSKDRWGSAVQAGVGTHFNLSQRFDVSFTCQYMIHLTAELEAEEDATGISIVSNKGSALEGHLLSTLSINYKLCRLWGK